MTVHVHTLGGCASLPLAAYLKALGVLRLVGEQADPGVRARWADRGFQLITALNEDELVEFFLARYAPTPLLAPWNGGSGFYPGYSSAGIDAIAKSCTPRLAKYAAEVRWVLKRLAGVQEVPAKQAKSDFLAELRRTWRGGAQAWLASATILLDEGDPKYPALLGSGGNDGQLDFATNFMHHLIELFDPGSGEARPGARSLLEGALYGVPIVGMIGKAIGQFSPGDAGGPNSSEGYRGNGAINRWDFVLMLEGALLLEVAAVRRLDSAKLPLASAPFAVRGRPAGYATASDAEKSSRGEQWFPLWSQPATLEEVRLLFTEGRLSVGSTPARTALEAAQAVSRLGTARGITAFERYGFLERNGRSNLAVPLGRWNVQPTERVELLDEVRPWIERFGNAARGKNAPAAFQRHLRRLENATLELCRSNTTDGWQALLCALAEAEEGLRKRPKATGSARLQPLPALSPAWIEAIDDGTPEVRLARAIGSQTAPGWLRAQNRADLGSIRRHCLPLEPGGRARFLVRDETLAASVDVVWRGRDLTTDLLQVALRRGLQSLNCGLGRLLLAGRSFASLEDVEAFVDGRLDEQRLSLLTRGLMAVDWRRHKTTAPASCGQAISAPPPPLYALALIRSLYAPARPATTQGSAGADLVAAQTPPLDLAPLRLLAQGRPEEAVRRAIARHRGAGLTPRHREVLLSPDQGRRLAASIAIPLDSFTHTSLLWALRRPATDKV